MSREGTRSILDMRKGEWRKRRVESDFVDAVGLNSWVDELGDELLLEILCTLSQLGTQMKRRERITSRKNFFAPTARAFLRAAS
jgi:hypothetical protein